MCDPASLCEIYAGIQDVIKVDFDWLHIYAKDRKCKKSTT
jgi:hypothetical protein